VPRLPPDRSWWDIDFLPCRGEQGLLFILGRIAVSGLVSLSPSTSLSEGIQVLREKVLHRYNLEALASVAPALDLVREQVRLAARVGVPILLTGEAGVGKEWIARTIHALSAHRSRPFVALNCRRLPGEVIAGVLFGEGALASQVEAGTVYLQEPSHLPRELQGRICDLMILGEEGEQPSSTLPPVRIMAGCSGEPADEVRSGRLLEEFLCCLSPIRIRIPPLRERRQDLPALGERMLELAREASGSHFQGCTPDAWETLAAHSWPGNLAEFLRILFGAGAHAAGPLIEKGDLPLYLRLPPSAGTGEAPGLPLRSILEEAERRLIALALHKTGGNKSKAAAILALNRPALLRRMEALGIGEW
jgi:DNA-binding NtrC family response regulator